MSDWQLILSCGLYGSQCTVAWMIQVYMIETQVPNCKRRHYIQAVLLDLLNVLERRVVATIESDIYDSIILSVV